MGHSNQDFVEHFRLGADGKVRDTQYQLASREAPYRSKPDPATNARESTWGWHPAEPTAERGGTPRIEDIVCSDEQQILCMELMFILTSYPSCTAESERGAPIVNFTAPSGQYINEFTNPLRVGFESHEARAIRRTSSMTDAA